MSIPFEPIAGRMLQAGRLKNISALAADLNITRQALSNYKKRGEMPAHLIIEFAAAHALSVDWLISGGVQNPAGVTSTATDGGISLKAVNLTDDEAGCVVKLLTVLRGKDKTKAEALKYSINALEAAPGREAANA